jgi:hypothetical protein
MEKLSSTDYDFDVVEQGGFVITLTQTQTGATKVFKLATGNRQSLVQHMNTLTDSQCEQWFNATKKSKKEKA